MKYINALKHKFMNSHEQSLHTNRLPSNLSVRRNNSKSKTCEMSVVHSLIDVVTVYPVSSLLLILISIYHGISRVLVQ